MPFPQAAREAGLRAWISVLRERHPNVIWVPSTELKVADDDSATVDVAATNAADMPPS